MRHRIICTIGAFASLAGTSVQAQTFTDAVNWNGAYVGVDVATGIGGHGEGIAAIDPVRDARFVYLEGPSRRTLSIEPDQHQSTGVGIRAGVLQQMGRLVWGIEAQMAGGDIERSFAVGPVDAGPLRTVFISGVPAPTRTLDSLSADLNIDQRVAVRLRAGLTVGDRALVSVFAGPSRARARLTVVQDSVIEYFICDNHPVRPGLCFTREVAVSGAGTADDQLWGGVVGGAVDFRIDARWSFHGEVALTQYESVEAQSAGVSGGNSRLAWEPELYTVNLGVDYRF